MDPLVIKRVAADFADSIDPETGAIKPGSPLAVYFLKNIEILQGDNLFTATNLLAEGGTLVGAAKAIWNLSNVPKVTDYDPFDWNYTKFQKFATKEVTLDNKGTYSIKRFHDVRDTMRMYQDYKNSGIMLLLLVISYPYLKI